MGMKGFICCLKNNRESEVLFGWTLTWICWLDGNDGDDCGHGDGQGHTSFMKMQIHCHVHVL